MARVISLRDNIRYTPVKFQDPRTSSHNGILPTPPSSPAQHWQSPSSQLGLNAHPSPELVPFPKYDLPKANSTTKAKLHQLSQYKLGSSLSVQDRVSPLARPPPTVQAIENVIKRLKSVHTYVSECEKEGSFINKDKRETGRGECPDVLHGLVRTILSQSTSGTTVQNMMIALEETYSCEAGGRLNYGNIFDSGLDLLESKLRIGGLTKKAGWIMTILEWLDKEEKKVEVAQRSFRLDLQWLHLLPDDKVLDWLLRFTGVGFKTASCVLLYNMGRNSLAVDTHVNRIATSLGWLAPDTPDEQAFFHFDAVIPDHYKVDLHDLFVQHGRRCDKCCEVEPTSDHDIMECPLEDIVRRGRGKAGGGQKKKNKRSKTQKKKQAEKLESDEETRDGDDGEEEDEQEKEIDSDKQNDEEVHQRQTPRLRRSTSVASINNRHRALPTPSPSPLRRASRAVKTELDDKDEILLSRVRKEEDENSTIFDDMRASRKRLIRSAAPEYGLKEEEQDRMSEGGVGGKRRKVATPAFWVEMP